ncbi:hypothetical protein G4V62_18475 [Bacillaceae bacterium SIJ1]|uniref:hypothetical protein n=1 Tax=Litoribacterium kuwaitense TaxID=1398745 RepID=UPI0013EB613D|nr:hypothetical protein [Litoribacterium kuwaitense]NGP46827.1 hypothetical protein [Litoribacterium kuwaitense]
MGEGEGVNLNRNPNHPEKEDGTVTVGTEYQVNVTNVLKGDVTQEEVFVSVQGGSYENQKAPLKSTLEKGKTYLFFLFAAAQGPPHYYDGIQPNIFEISKDQIELVTNVEQYRQTFQDEHLSKSAFYSNLKQAIQSTEQSR